MTLSLRRCHTICRLSKGEFEEKSLCLLIGGQSILASESVYLLDIDDRKVWPVRHSDRIIRARVFILFNYRWVVVVCATFPMPRLIAYKMKTRRQTCLSIMRTVSKFFISVLIKNNLLFINFFNLLIKIRATSLI